MKTLLEIIGIIAWSVVMTVVTALTMEEFFCFEDVTLATGLIVAVLIQGVTILAVRGAVVTYEEYTKPRDTPPNK